jgi:hypothetical protein
MLPVRSSPSRKREWNYQVLPSQQMQLLTTDRLPHPGRGSLTKSPRTRLSPLGSKKVSGRVFLATITDGITRKSKKVEGRRSIRREDVEMNAQSTWISAWFGELRNLRVDTDDAACCTWPDICLGQSVRCHAAQRLDMPMVLHNVCRTVSRDTHIYPSIIRVFISNFACAVRSHTSQAHAQ